MLPYIRRHSAPPPHRSHVIGVLVHIECTTPDDLPRALLCVIGRPWLNEPLVASDTRGFTLPSHHLPPCPSLRTRIAQRSHTAEIMRDGAARGPLAFGHHQAHRNRFSCRIIEFERLVPSRFILYDEVRAWARSSAASWSLCIEALHRADIVCSIVAIRAPFPMPVSAFGIERIVGLDRLALAPATGCPLGNRLFFRQAPPSDAAAALTPLRKFSACRWSFIGLSTC